MFALVEIAGRQFKVSPKDTIAVPRLKAMPGDEVSFERVFLVGDEKQVRVGAPVLAGTRVAGRVLDHGKADKVVVFKKKRRKGYRVRRGHRQGFTRVQITAIA